MVCPVLCTSIVIDTLSLIGLGFESDSKGKRLNMTRQDHFSPVEPVGTKPQSFKGQGIKGALYSTEERHRRDESVWTIVQGVLAPLQFVVFLGSLFLVLRSLFTGEGAFAADISSY